MELLRRRCRAASVICLSWVLGGCSGESDSAPDIFPVHGKVLVDGAPKPYVRVGLIPVDAADATPVATGMTDKDGEFELCSFVETAIKKKDAAPVRKADGAKPGEYFVAISWLKPIRPNGSEPEFGDELLPTKYQNPAKSGLPELKVKIEETDNELPPIQLKRR